LIYTRTCFRVMIGTSWAASMNPKGWATNNGPGRAIPQPSRNLNEGPYQTLRRKSLTT
jgi:hypothetical protein